MYKLAAEDIYTAVFEAFGVGAEASLCTEASWRHAKLIPEGLSPLKSRSHDVTFVKGFVLRSNRVLRLQG